MSRGGSHLYPGMRQGLSFGTESCSDARTHLFPLGDRKETCSDLRVPPTYRRKSLDAQGRRMALALRKLPPEVHVHRACLRVRLLEGSRTSIFPITKLSVSKRQQQSTTVGSQGDKSVERCPYDMNVQGLLRAESGAKTQRNHPSLTKPHASHQGAVAAGVFKATDALKATKTQQNPNQTQLLIGLIQPLH